MGTDVWDLLFRSRPSDILIRSALLVVAVTDSSVAIAEPLAWLTVRTGLPLRGAWSVITVLPLVIPSYVGGFLMVVALWPKGTLQRWLAPLDVECLPDVFGFPWAMLTLTLLSFPYVFPPVRAALGRLDPGLEETSLSLGKGAGGYLFPDYLADAATRYSRRRSTGGPLHP